MLPTRCVLSILFCFVFAVAASGCAGAKPYQTNFDIPTLALHEREDISKEGVQIGISPITRANEKDFPQLARSVQWREPDPGATHTIGTEGRVMPSTQTIVRSGMVELVPLPAFFVGISNKSGSSLSLAGMQIEVEDNAHRRYALILKPDDVRQRFFRDVLGGNPFIAGDKELMDRLMQEIMRLPILNPAVTINNGDVWRGYLVLDVNAHSPKEYYAMMKSLQGFTIRLKEISTRSGPAEFTFAVDKAEMPAALTCPGEVKEPLPEKCTVSPTAAAPAGEPSKGR